MYRVSAARSRLNVSGSEMCSQTWDVGHVVRLQTLAHHIRIMGGPGLCYLWGSVNNTLSRTGQLQVNETLGASRSAACSISNRCASWKLNIEAIIVVGNTSRPVL